MVTLWLTTILALSVTPSTAFSLGAPADSIIRYPNNPRFTETSRDTVAGTLINGRCGLKRSYVGALGPGIVETVIEQNVTTCTFIVARGKMAPLSDSAQRERDKGRMRKSDTITVRRPGT